MNLTKMEKNQLDFIADVLELKTLYLDDGALNLALVQKLKREGYLSKTFGGSI